MQRSSLTHRVIPSAVWVLASRRVLTSTCETLLHLPLLPRPRRHSPPSGPVCIPPGTLRVVVLRPLVALGFVRDAIRVVIFDLGGGGGSTTASSTPKKILSCDNGQAFAWAGTATLANFFQIGWLPRESEKWALQRLWYRSALAEAWLFFEEKTRRREDGTLQSET